MNPRVCECEGAKSWKILKITNSKCEQLVLFMAIIKSKSKSEYIEYVVLLGWTNKQTLQCSEGSEGSEGSAEVFECGWLTVWIKTTTSSCLDLESKLSYHHVSAFYNIHDRVVTFRLLIYLIISMSLCTRSFINDVFWTFTITRFWSDNHILFIFCFIDICSN